MGAANYPQKRLKAVNVENTEIRGMITPSGNGEQSSFLLWDISDEGICIWTHSPLEENTKVALTLSLPFPSIIQAEVKWCEKTGGEHGYRIGLSISEDSRDKAARIIESLQSTKPH